jgi:hypothetical protein
VIENWINLEGAGSSVSRFDVDEIIQSIIAGDLDFDFGSSEKYLSSNLFSKITR